MVQAQKTAQANLENIRKIFTLPEESSTLSMLEESISTNLIGFLKDHIVAGDLSPQDIERDFLDTRIPDNPMFVAEQTDFLLNRVVSQSVHTSSPSFIGHMTSAIPYFMLPLAKIMTALNQNLVKIETAKAFTPMERQVIGMLHRLVYERDDEFYKRYTQDAETPLGVMCSGGTIANITALWVARNQKLPPKGSFGGVAVDGLPAAYAAHNIKGLSIYISTRGHYSLKKAIDLVGIGQSSVKVIPVEPNHKISIEQLEKQIQQDREAGIEPLAIIGVAGTTETGSVDSLSRLGEIAARRQCHYHVDAAWGGPTLFSERYKKLLAGIELADSVTIDAHKQLYVPVGAGICLFKDPTSADHIGHTAEYIIRKGSRDLGKYTLEGSRSGMALLIHSGLRIIGREGYELLIDLGIGKAGQFAKMIEAQDDFELVTEPELNLLTYRFVPNELKALLSSDNSEVVHNANLLLNELTELIQKRQRAAGKTFVSRTRLESYRYNQQILTVFRVVLANPLTTRAILQSILAEQQEYGRAIMDSEFGHRVEELQQHA